MLRRFLSRNSRHPQRPRNAERFRTTGLRCYLGEVVDLSAAGARVICSRSESIRRGEIFTLAIQSGSQSVRVVARVAWTRRSLLSGRSVGLQFLNVRPGIAAALVQLARFGCITLDHEASRSKGTGCASPVRAAIEVEDLYAMLGVQSSASQEEIRSAYHTLVKQFHPDRNPSRDSAARFAEISKAYRVLRNPAHRRRYDEMLARSVGTWSSTSAA
jgi:hypothetical protein